MRKRWWGNGRGGGEGDVLRSVALMTTTSWSLVFLAIPTAQRRRTHSDTLLSIWAADCQARLSRECSGLLESHFLGSEFYWVVTLLHGKKDIRNRHNFTEYFQKCLKRAGGQPTQSSAIHSATEPQAHLALQAQYPK